MTWGWTSTTRNYWVYDATWAVKEASHRWYVVRGGRHLLEDYGDAGAAMEHADRLRIAEAA